MGWLKFGYFWILKIDENWENCYILYRKWIGPRLEEKTVKMTEERFNEIMTENGFYVNEGYEALLSNLLIIGYYKPTYMGKEYIACLWDIEIVESGFIVRKTERPTYYADEKALMTAVEALSKKYRNLKKLLKKEQIKKVGEKYDIR